MDRVVFKIETESGARASEIMADLRNVAETLYYPMKLVGFWDYQEDLHLCPEEERRQECPHKLPESDSRRVDYVLDLQRKRRASLEVYFPHAGIAIYMATDTRGP